MVFPLKNEEYGSFFWLRREVGAYLGFGWDQNTWGHSQTGIVDSCIQSGVMQFYFPPPIGGEKGTSRPYSWSFLNPLSDLEITAGTASYQLPADFSGVLGEFTIDGTTNRIPVVSEAQLRTLSGAGETGTPKFAAIRPRRGDGSSEQTWEAIFYPVPAVNTVLKFRYSIAPDPMTPETPWPLGGRQYAELVLQACLAVAEERITKQGGGPAASRFMDRLASAIQLDMQSALPTEDGIWEDLGEGNSLGITRGYLKRMIGREMDFGPNPAAWTTNQTRQVEVVLQSGLRKFYHPGPLPGERWGHKWEFMQPVRTLQLIAGQYEYDLPDDFGSIEGTISYAPGQSVIYPDIVIVGENQVRNRLQREDSSARPVMAAVRSKEPTDSLTVYELILWPVPDENYETYYRSNLNPTAGSDDAAVPHGGQPHAQTLIEACLAAAEESAGKQGLHSSLFIECLRGSVSHDRLAASPSTIGYNRDRSDRIGDFSDWHGCDENIVVYNGYVP
jgi:hypothetical protein